VNAAAPAARRTQQEIRIYTFPRIEVGNKPGEAPPQTFGCLTVRNESHLAEISPDEGFRQSLNH
jgi:hypothetical protein